MIFKEHPKRDMLITGIVAAIAVLILLIAILPLLSVLSDTVKGLIIAAAIVVVAYPIVKHFAKRANKKTGFEQRHGRKLK